MMTLEELDRLIEEVELWHGVRVELDKKPRRKRLVMTTLPKVLRALLELRLQKVALELAEQHNTP